jgi:hypothetical protein
MVAVGREVRQKIKMKRIQENHLNQFASQFADLDCGVVGACDRPSHVTARSVVRHVVFLYRQPLRKSIYNQEPLLEVSRAAFEMQEDGAHTTRRTHFGRY